ncbi:cuticle protein 7-like [Cherax quadricarinatus]|uniref:cuticle protein 7-like n=1 Tax=Cherax quadricarinatus TaxID=27406 RepID=UPI00387ED946
MSLSVVWFTILVVGAFASPDAPLNYQPTFNGPSHGAPTPGPAYGPPSPRPAYGPPSLRPAYGPPTPGPAYGPPTPGPAYGPPTPGPAYGPPSPRPAYGPPTPAPVYGVPTSEVPAHYNFTWQVKDDASGNDYGHQETRDGADTQGSYYVLLPDGRLERVTYTVNGDSGYVAQVTYEGHTTSQSYYTPTPGYEGHTTPQNYYSPTPAYG